MEDTSLWHLQSMYQQGPSLRERGSRHALCSPYPNASYDQSIPALGGVLGAGFFFTVASSNDKRKKKRVFGMKMDFVMNKPFRK